MWFFDCKKFLKNVKDVNRTLFIRWGSMLIAFGSYVIIPVLLVMVSILLILESGSVLDVIKDTLSLLFLNEINNYLQVRNAPDGFKWTIKISSKKATELMRKKNIFSYLLVCMFAILAIVTTKVVYTGSAAYSGTSTPQGGGIKVHPSILFNLARFRSVWDGFISWAVFIVILAMIYGVYLLTLVVVKFLEWREQRPRNKDSWAREWFEDDKAYDDDDWRDDAVPFEELAEQYDDQEEEVRLEEEAEQKRLEDERKLEEARVERARFAALNTSRPPPPLSAPAPPQSASVPCLCH